MRIWLDLILKKEIGKAGLSSGMERSPIKDIEIKHLLRQDLTDRVHDRELYMKGIDYSYYYDGYSVYKTGETHRD